MEHIVTVLFQVISVKKYEEPLEHNNSIQLTFSQYMAISDKKSNNMRKFNIWNKIFMWTLYQTPKLIIIRDNAKYHIFWNVKLSSQSWKLQMVFL